MADKSTPNTSTNPSTTPTPASAEPHLKDLFTGMKWMFEDPFQRSRAFADELGRLEQKSAEQAKASIDEMARLSKESIVYGTKLAAEWRGLWMESQKRFLDL